MKEIGKTFFILLLLLTAVEQSRSAPPMLPLTYSANTNVEGWLMSEKLDGVRGYWDGRRLYSKNGRLFSPPPEFTRQLPPFELEGEIWGGRGTYEKTVSIVSKQQPHSGWLQLTYAIFDVPQASGSFMERLEKAGRWFTDHPSAFAYVIPQTRVQNREHLLETLARIETAGGEGLIVRNPAAGYRPGRSAEILKVKSHQDTEARVVSHLPGKGRNGGRLGALLVEEGNGLRFKIGSGFSDSERENPPPIGSLITFKYYGRYASGIPKFPSFLRLRRDRDY